MEFKQISHGIKELDTEKGIVEAYANVYNNIDSYGDISMPGSFTKTVKENFKRLRVLKNHWSSDLLGVAKELDPKDPYGLFTVTQFNMRKESARDMFYDIQLAIDNNQNAELSIGYEVIASKIDEVNGREVQRIFEYKLYEYSFLTSWAANELAITTGLKTGNASQHIMDMLVKAYNLPYSDSRLITIENLLKSLDGQPGNSTTVIEEPTEEELIKHIQQTFSLK